MIGQLLTIREACAALKATRLNQTSFNSAYYADRYCTECLILPSLDLISAHDSAHKILTDFSKYKTVNLMKT
jgi:hypothetical protein